MSGKKRVLELGDDGFVVPDDAAEDATRIAVRFENTNEVFAKLVAHPARAITAGAQLCNGRSVAWCHPAALMLLESPATTARTIGAGSAGSNWTIPDRVRERRQSEPRSNPPARDLP